MVNEVEANGGVIGKGEREVRIKGLGDGQVHGKKYYLRLVKLCQYFRVRQTFVVVEDGVIPYKFRK